MQKRGCEESQAAYVFDDPRKLIGQIRRLGDAAYQIMSSRQA